MPVLSSCSDEDVEETPDTKPLTVTLYGIKGEGTTDEAIKLVENRLNVYSEGNLSTRVLLRLFTEDEYYAKLDEAFAAAEEYEKQDNNFADLSGNNGTAYPEERGTQVDIFMVRGSEMFAKYNEEYTVQLNLADKSGLMKKYISDRYFALTVMSSNGVLGNKHPNGIPNNAVYGEYTYLLVNKEVANRYGYAEKNLDTLPELNNLLVDAKRDFGSYITLYNAPEINLDSFGGTMFGTVIEDTDTAFTMKAPTSLLENGKFVEYAKYLTLFKGYITEGDAHSLPTDKKVAAAFIKGDAGLPEQYKDNYLVIPYAKPVMEDLGTVFCVSKYANDPTRALEIVSLLQTNVEYRNIFQYGVEDVHYRVDDYTGIIDIISDDYNMNPADTGNLFILKENSSMDERTKALCANNWELGKKQLRDTVVAPYLLFNPDMTDLDYDGLKAESDRVLSQLMSYQVGSAKTFEAHVAQLNAAFKNTTVFLTVADNSALPATADETTENGETTAPETTTPETTTPETTEPETTEPEPEEPEVAGTILEQYIEWCAANNIK